MHPSHYIQPSGPALAESSKVENVERLRAAGEVEGHREGFRSAGDFDQRGDTARIDEVDPAGIDVKRVGVHEGSARCVTTVL